MGGVSIWHWIVVGVIIMLLFGRGKVSELMGDVAKGIKSFKKGMSEDETPPPSAQQPVDPKIIDQVQAGNAAAQTAAAQAKTEQQAKAEQKA